MRFLAPQPVSIGKILDASFKLYRASFSKLLVFMLISASFQVIFGLLQMWLYKDQAQSPNLPLIIYNEHPVLMICVLLISSIITFTLHVAIIYRINNLEHQQQDSIADALSFGFRKTPRLFLGYFLYILAVMIGTLLLIIPGIILMLSLSFFLYFVVLDSLKAYASLRASHRLIWGNWWRTLGVYTAPGVIMIVLIFSLGGIIGLVTGGNIFVTQGISNFVMAFITPYFFTLGYVQFHDLKLRKSGSDLEARLNN
ncbi:hypothetical protein [Methylomonas sp. AM2-LC]|uniref:hypothetical protein n=1 Tax=Methylomonas sp. AM2-LC TaxID=3153301 RepID=UPI003264F88D